VTASATLFKEVAIRGRYALVGAGQLGAMSLRLWPSSVAPPEFILDSAKTGDLQGIEIRDLRSHVQVPGVTYLASVFKMTPREMKDVFQAIGQNEILTVYDFFEEFTPTIFTNGWRNFEPTAETECRLDRLPQFYADETSQRICQAVTAWRYRRELVDDYPIGPEENKYDLSLFGRAGMHYGVIYDCGCFNFGLMKSLMAADISFDRLVAFEPDPVSYEVCRERMAEWRPMGKGEITLDQHAVSDRNRSGTFLANGLLSARLIDSLDHPGLIAVDTWSLDAAHEHMFGWNDASSLRTLIKLHIEGAELAALKGAVKLIKKSRVDILLNLSHDEISYLDIPEFLAGFGCYDIFLRSHCLFGEGLTLFARHQS
jgi:FkbM family methyltransferase